MQIPRKNDEISSALKAEDGKDIIIVTNHSPTRRVHLLWTKYFGSRGAAIVHGIPYDDYVADRWSRHASSVKQVTHEVLEIIHAWQGRSAQDALGNILTVSGETNSPKPSQTDQAAGD